MMTGSTDAAECCHRTFQGEVGHATECIKLKAASLMDAENPYMTAAVRLLQGFCTCETCCILSQPHAVSVTEMIKLGLEL